jgi:hypothetical protein
MYLENNSIIHINQSITNHNTENLLPVIMCSWKREESFKEVVEELNLQDHQDFHLFVWNNNWQKKDYFEKILRENSKFRCSIYHSEKNIGGFGRFYFARHINSLSNFQGFCVFIDDDQKFETNTLSVFLAEVDKKKISSQWAWKLFSLEYYSPENKTPVYPGDNVDYCGTGGMIIDMDIFNHDDFFNCPENYWFIEDIWLSFYANHFMGYKLTKSSTKFINGSDEHNLWEKIRHLKGPMLRYLVETYNWKITYNKNK